MANSLSDIVSNWVSQRQQREQMGDTLDKAREVDHSVYFSSRAKAARAAGALEALGFQVSLERSLLRTSLVASRTESLTDESVIAMLNQILPIVDSNGGSYDGFGGPIVE